MFGNLELLRARGPVVTDDSDGKDGEVVELDEPFTVTVPAAAQ